MTRKELKALIKECLVEVLNEGLGGSLSAPVANVRGMTESRQPSRQPQAQKGRRFDPTLDTPVNKSSSLKNAIHAEAGGNKLMASILADTANTTLQEMLSAEGSLARGQIMAPAGSIERVAEEAAPEDLFGEETAGRWADLAFMDIPRSNTH